MSASLYDSKYTATARRSIHRMVSTALSFDSIEEYLSDNRSVNYPSLRAGWCIIKYSNYRINIYSSSGLWLIKHASVLFIWNVIAIQDSLQCLSGQGELLIGTGPIKP